MGSATHRWPHGPARRRVSPFLASRVKPATSPSNSRRSPTSALSGSPRRASPRWCRSSRRRSQRSPTIRSPRWCRTSVWSPAGEQTFTVADVPGLIPGASDGRGLGLDFLRHLERCAVLVHVVDCATMDPGRDPISDIDALEAELAAYTPTLQGDSSLGDLADRPRAVVLNKIDVPDARELADFVREEVAERLRLAGVRGIHDQPGWPAAVDVRAMGHGLRRIARHSPPWRRGAPSSARSPSTRAASP